MKKIAQDSFKGQHVFVGIDVHKKQWVVSLRCNKMELQTVSMNPSPLELSHFMKKHYPEGIYHTVYEAGFCGFWIHEQLIALNIDNRVVHPQDVPTMGKEKSQKRDPIDSHKLARELENGSLKGIFVPDVFHQQLRSLCRLREKTMREMIRLKNRIKGHLAFYGIEQPEGSQYGYWSKRFLERLEKIEFQSPQGKTYLNFCLKQLYFLRTHLLSLIRELRMLVRQQVLIKPIVDRLHQVVGIGFLTTMTLYTELIDMRRFKKFDQLAAFVGLVPSLQSSGDWESRAHLSSRHNHYLRYLLIEAAWVAVRRDPALMERFIELCKRMKKQEAIIRIAKNLLRRVRHVWLTGEPYQTGVLA